MGTGTKYKLTEKDITEIGHFYYGYYMVSRDHRLSMEYVESMGYDWKDLLKIRRSALKIMKRDGVK